MMIDLHNHLIPGIDDGPEDMETSLDMARMAVRNGITHMVCTPHIHAGRYENTSTIIRQAGRALVGALRKAGIPLRIGAAAEVRFGSEMLQGIQDGTIPFLGEWQGKRVLLLEFPHGEIPFGAERMTQWLIDRNVLPLIAHPERNKGLMQQPSRLKPFLQQGCLIQLTASSVAGQFGERAQDLSTQLLEAGVVTIIATDAHNLIHRPPELHAGVEAAARILGERDAQRLVCDTPWSIAQAHFV